MNPASAPAPQISHHAASAQAPQGRFETMVDGHRCVADYLRQGQRMLMHHTEVPATLQGRGIAAQLVAAALAYARSAGLQVVPSCSYVQAYLRRHPEQQDLLAPPG